MEGSGSRRAISQGQGFDDLSTKFEFNTWPGSVYSFIDKTFVFQENSECLIVSSNLNVLSTSWKANRDVFLDEGIIEK